MKSFKLVLLSIVCLSIFSCSSDDESSDNAVAVEGTWRLTAINSESAFDLNNDGTETNTFVEETNCYQNETVVFNSGGTGVTNSNSYAEITAEIVVGTTNEYEYSVDCKSEVDSDTFTWAQNGNQIIITDSSGFPFTATLSGSQFSFVVPEGFYATDSSFSFEVTEDLTFIYTKQ